MKKVLVSLFSIIALSANAFTITGAGASFPYPVYAKWAEQYKAETGRFQQCRTGYYRYSGRSHRALINLIVKAQDRRCTVLLMKIMNRFYAFCAVASPAPWAQCRCRIQRHTPLIIFLSRGNEPCGPNPNTPKCVLALKSRCTSPTAKFWLKREKAATWQPFFIPGCFKAQLKQEVTRAASHT